jgi:hypothetical protein
MNNNNCYCGFNCLGTSVIVSLIVGVIAAILTITATITVTPAFLWVLFGIAVVSLGILLVVSAFARSALVRACLCRFKTVLLAGILGTILFSLILLGITFAATSVTGAIITGILFAFFALILSQTACLIDCLASCSDDNF